MTRGGRATSMVLGLGALALSSCNCDPTLQEEPKPKAVLAYQDKTTPDEDHLSAAMPVTLLGQHADISMELRNDGKAPLEVANIVLGSDPMLCPAASGNFVIVDPAASGGTRSSELAAGTKMNITVRYSPSSGANECIVLKVTSNDGAHATLKAVFTGKGDAPRLCTDRVMIDFGDLEAGMTKDDVVTLNSCGTHPVTIATITQNEFFPPFSADALTLPTTLQPMGTLSVPVHFHPTTAGVWNDMSAKAGLLTFTTDNGEVYQIELVGKSHTPPSCVLDAQPTAVNFSVVSDMMPHTLNVILTNRGQRACTVQNAAMMTGGPFTAAFQGGFMPGGVLMPSSTATVAVTFTPPTTAQLYDDALIVTSDDPINPSLSVPVEANVQAMPVCTLTVDPPTVNFGVVPLNSFRAMGINVRNAGSDICFITSVAFEPGTNPQFVNTSSMLSFLMPGATKTLTVGFRPTVDGSAQGRIKIRGTDMPFGGTMFSDFYVQLTARTGTTGICVTPIHLDFGVTSSPMTQDFNISACGSQAVIVSALDWTQPDSEFSLTAPPGTPFTLQPGEQHTVTVQYAPTDTQPDTAVIMVRSDDGVNPNVPVDMTGGPETVPPSAGRYLYYWQIPAGIAGGDVMKFPLQGNPVGTPFWGPRTGKACSGCHSISPDGKYVAVMEGPSMKFIETATGFELILGNQFSDPQYFSWRPQVNTTPPYQFAMGTGGIIKINALFDGFIRDLQGATDPAYLQTMPSWGNNGKIAFVKGQMAPMSQQSNSGATGFQGPTDILIVDENGGTPSPVPGASQNGAANYYPQFSPNGQWIAFTQSVSAATTISATDGQVKLVKSDLSGTVLPLTQLNGGDGPNSYPTWALDGTFLSFSSKRAGGAGNWDIWVAPMDPVTGVDGPARNVTELNTADFEHAAQWSP